MAEYNVGTASKESQYPSINFAIGQSCPVRCEGCYNAFGDTFTQGELVSADEIIDFAHVANEMGINRTVVSGGDPLSRPDIVEICEGLNETMDYVRLDTVGTQFLDDDVEIPILYKGRGLMSHYEPEQFKDAVSLINIPMDGATQKAALQFRKGRSNSLAEAEIVARKIVNAEIPLGINTVVNAANIDEIPTLKGVVEALGACQWRLFEFDPAGPNPAKHRDRLSLEPGLFRAATDLLKNEDDELQVFTGGLDNRGTYCMVNDAGMLYRRTGGSEELDTVGHITRDREKVVRRLGEHVAMFAQK